MDDVIKVINSCRNYLIAIGAVFLIAVIAVIAVRKLPEAKRKLVRSQTWIGAVLIVAVLINVICFGPMSTMIKLATEGNAILDETAADSEKVCEEIAEEGIVLLKNEGDILPLENTNKLNVFGWASTNPVYGGTGSGAVSDAYHKVDMIEGLENAGFELNQELIDFYTAYKDARYAVEMIEQDWTLPEPAISAYSDGIFENAEEFSDMALFVVARPGGENTDLPTDMTAVVDGSWKEQDATTGYTYFNGTYDDELNAGNDWEDGQHYRYTGNAAGLQKYHVHHSKQPGLRA